MLVPAWVVIGCAGGCASGPGPGDPSYAYNVRGAYAGRLMIAERPFEARLELRTSAGGRVTGSLRVVSPVEIDGDVRGRVIDDLLRITVGYDGSDGCDGRVEGILDIEPGGGTIDGPVTITDCGEPVGARLSVRRSGAGEALPHVPGGGDAPGPLPDTGAQPSGPPISGVAAPPSQYDQSRRSTTGGASTSQSLRP